MKRAGFTLPELVTTMFLMMIIAYLAFILIVPVVRSVSRGSGREGVYRVASFFFAGPAE